MKKYLLFLPLIIGMTSPTFAHNKANTNCRTSSFRGSTLISKTCEYRSGGCSGSCQSGACCKDALGTKYICCAGDHEDMSSGERVLNNPCKFIMDSIGCGAGKC